LILAQSDPHALYDYKNAQLLRLHRHFAVEYAPSIKPLQNTNESTDNYMEVKEKELSPAPCILNCKFETLRKEYNDLLDYVVETQRQFPGYDFSLQKFWLVQARKFKLSSVNEHASPFTFPRIPNLMILFDIFICTPISNAPCERGFSIQNLVKTDIKNRLSNQSLDCNMRIKLMAIANYLNMENLNFEALVEMFAEGEKEKPKHSSIRAEWKSFATENELQDQQNDDLDNNE
jgi:hypothetical protein